MTHLCRTASHLENGGLKMSDDRLAQFSAQRYVNLETYRKSGQGVRTPLWFIEQQGVLYMRTPAPSAKVKRIRNNPHVRIVPSDVRGNPIGEWIEGKAQLIATDDAEWVNQLVKRKYGLFKRLIDIRSRLKGTQYVVIAVHV